MGRTLREAEQGRATKDEAQGTSQQQDHNGGCGRWLWLWTTHRFTRIVPSGGHMNWPSQRNTIGGGTVFSWLN